MNDNDDLFHGLRAPEPPDDLRRHVLDRAAAALEGGSRPDAWIRLWESRQARLAWAASVLALAAGHLVLPPGDAAPGKDAATLISADSTEHEELADIVNLPRLSFDTGPAAGAVGTLEESETDPDGTLSRKVSEENAS